MAPTATAATPTAAAAAPTLSWMQGLWNVEVTPESTTTDSTARLSFRMPNGSRVVRSFSPSDTVQMVYAFVAVRTYFGDVCGVRPDWFLRVDLRFSLVLSCHVFVFRSLSFFHCACLHDSFVWCGGTAIAPGW